MTNITARHELAIRIVELGLVAECACAQWRSENISLDQLLEDYQIHRDDVDEAESQRLDREATWPRGRSCPSVYPPSADAPHQGPGWSGPLRCALSDVHEGDRHWNSGITWTKDVTRSRTSGMTPEENLALALLTHTCHECDPRPEAERCEARLDNAAAHAVDMGTA